MLLNVAIIGFTTLMSEAVARFLSSGDTNFGWNCAWTVMACGCLVSLIIWAVVLM